MCLPTSSRADPNPERWREVWAGADVARDVWLVYSGATVSPFSHIHGDGLRLRVVGGYGQYNYAGRRAGGITQFDADTAFTDALVGYLKRIGELTAKGFIGASFITHRINPFDAENLAIGDEVGIKGLVELWLNLGSDGWASLDMAWSQAHETRSARSRIGYRVWPSVGLGVEAGLNVDSQGDCDLGGDHSPECQRQFKKRHPELVSDISLLDYGRAGVFVRHEWAGGEVSLSVGALGGSLRAGDAAEVQPYATVNWLMQF